MTILSINISIAQKIIILKGDTLVTLEKKKVETLNEIALHREYLIRDLQLCDSIGLIRDSILLKREEEVCRYKSILELNNVKLDSYNSKISELEQSVRIKERQNKLLIGGGFLAVLMGIIFL
jgi:hypothetical protein